MVISAVARLKASYVSAGASARGNVVESGSSRVSMIVNEALAIGGWLYGSTCTDYQGS